MLNLIVVLARYLLRKLALSPSKTVPCLILLPMGCQRTVQVPKAMDIKARNKLIKHIFRDVRPWGVEIDGQLYFRSGNSKQKGKNI